MYVCSYAGSEKPHSGGNISFGPICSSYQPPECYRLHIRHYLCYVMYVFLTAFHECNRDDASSCGTYHSILPLPFMHLVGPVFHEKEKRSEGLYICRTFQTVGSAYLIF